MMPLRLAPAYRDAVKVALALQVPATLLLSLVLDDGTMAKIGFSVLAGFWTGAAAIMIRRPQTPKALDLFYLKWGYVPLLVLAFVIAATIISSSA